MLHLENQTLPFPLRPPLAAAFFAFLGFSSLSDASESSLSLLSSTSFLALFLLLLAEAFSAAFFLGSLMHLSFSISTSSSSSSLSHLQKVHLLPRTHQPPLSLRKRPNREIRSKSAIVLLPTLLEISCQIFKSRVFDTQIVMASPNARLASFARGSQTYLNLPNQ